MFEILRLLQDLIKYIEENIIILAVHVNPENIGLCFFFSLLLSTLRQLGTFHFISDYECKAHKLWIFIIRVFSIRVLDQKASWQNLEEILG